MSLCDFPTLPIAISLSDILPTLPSVPTIPTLPIPLTIPCLADMFD